MTHTVKKKPSAITGAHMITAPMTDDEFMLRRWCIEQATRWPLLKEVRLGTPVPSGQATTGVDMDVDLIGRARGTVRMALGAEKKP